MGENETAERLSKTRKKVILIVGIILVILAIIVSCTSFITDIIWFGEVGYISVFLTEILTKIKIGIPIFIVVAALSILILTALKNNFLKKNNFTLDSERDKKSVRRVRLILSIVLGLFLSIVLLQRLWFQMLQFFNSTSFNIKDPLFSKDVGF